MKYFRYFPKVEYSDNTLTNIIVRAKIRDKVRSNRVNFYSYTVKEGEKPWIISHKYYGNADLAWLVFYSNDMIDPVYDWVLDYKEFIDYIEAKYGNIEIPQTTIQYFYDANGHIIDQFTFDNTPENERSFIYQYDYEVRLNEAKRQIRLLDNDFAQKAADELRSLFR